LLTWILANNIDRERKNLRLAGRPNLRTQFGRRSLVTVTEHLQVSELPEMERLKAVEVAIEVLHGIGITLGLSLFWIMEAVRDRVFRLLDRVNVPPRTRPASAFPPGQPRKYPPRKAR
jgi:hypothetical protein